MVERDAQHRAVFMRLGTTADLADNSAATRSPQGIALNGAANDQPLAMHEKGPITLGAVLTPGVSGSWVAAVSREI